MVKCPFGTQYSCGIPKCASLHCPGDMKRLRSRILVDVTDLSVVNSRPPTRPCVRQDFMVAFDFGVGFRVFASDELRGVSCRNLCCWLVILQEARNEILLERCRIQCWLTDLTHLRTGQFRTPTRLKSFVCQLMPSVAIVHPARSGSCSLSLKVHVLTYFFPELKKTETLK